MITITQTEFRKHMREYMEAVGRGETLRVYRHGRPFAQVSPLPSDGVPSWKRDRPLIRLPEGVSASRTVIEERDEGW